MDGGDARAAMNRMYGWTRHVYDATRKYYLLGRDAMIENLNVYPGMRVCEVGCGTARNLIKIARRWPGATLSGVDASDAMLVTARANLARAGLSGHIALAQGLAQDFAGGPYDRVVFSYALSIIPPWREALDHALDLLGPGGEVHIVDFGGMEGVPGPARAALFWWLALFGVHWKPEVVARLRALDSSTGTRLVRLSPHRGGYAYHAVLRKA
ncbi:MAG TPA: SAM-dependent methyltransferase [Rhodospirillaceae bacterium]|jgi:S-adenosylmethionine-diacylgycerolhomoserine-N-methlytransferase|nr:class I SAM-dependent methyltransferase [Alphaproteobacteria bacterium]HBH26157.1 SAM-dependent methyltransferase [Rhodospirillaceae bacterium]